jgi:RHS repeat-associated protein
MTGTGSVSVPIAISSTRAGFNPQLALTYDSGAGNDVFGVGWRMALPVISRKTDKGLPQYRDPEDSDVFILSGNEDLVPVLPRREDGKWVKDEVERDGYRVRFYRPRVEGLFARIERWTRTSDGDIHWRTFTKDNVLTIYGQTAASRISDPDQPLHTFKWLISASYDGKGNAIRYDYAAEDLRGVDKAKPSERRRDEAVNRYLKRILYGNRKPLRGHEPESGDPEWMFEVVLDYGDEGYSVGRDAAGEEYARIEGPSERSSWHVRRDPFSTYRSGFEIRTYRLCQRTLMFHRFPEELGVVRYLVRSTEFHHDERGIGSFLIGIVQSGYKHVADGSYLRKSLPRLEFGYTASPLEADDPGPFELRDADAANLPEGLDGSTYRLVDLDGEGIPGVLAEQGTSWYYKRNLGNGHFGSTALIHHKPVSSRLSATQQLLDVSGQGQANLVTLAPGLAGFYERTPDPDRGTGLNRGWGRFRPFHKNPVVNWSDPNLRFVDLTGDGVADILITEDVALRWHASLQAAGYGPAVRIPAPGDEEQGPRVVFSDPTQSIYLADMSGDSLSDIVRIRNGEVCYWPNLGYGRFGPKIVMARSPWFDQSGLFDNRRIRLADTDGSGTVDFLYLTDTEIHVYLNECGNALSERKVLDGVSIPGTSAISVVDFLGRGTACLVWSSALPSDAQRPLRYVDLMRGEKPHLLTRISNNLGAETRVTYASSTEFYLADEAAGHPWVTALPFPVHVVKQVETFDYAGRSLLVSTASYHHGYYDAMEREFRGFGRVDRVDAEEFGTTSTQTFPDAANDEQEWHVPPLLTKTWYHTGVFVGADRISRHLAHEYYREPLQQLTCLLDDTILLGDLSPDEAREACRALTGSKLREEVYACDGSESRDRPYITTESNSTIRLLQPRGPNLHCVFLSHPREVVTANYERKLYGVGDMCRADARFIHSLTLEVDDFGNVLRAASIAYGRRLPDQSPLFSDTDHAEQAKLLATQTVNYYTNSIHQPDAYRAPALAASRMYELINLAPSMPTYERSRLLPFGEVDRQLFIAGDGNHDLPYEDVTATGATGHGPYRRLISDSRTLYRSDSLEHLLALGEIESLALPGDNYSLALTPGLVGEIYGGKVVVCDDALRREGAYTDLNQDGHWWVPSGRTYYSPGASDDPATERSYARQHFYLPHRFEDPFGNLTFVAYDPHDLLVVSTCDPVGNEATATNDYRILQPSEATDPNGNRSAVSFDALGMVVGTAVMGKSTEQLGDSLDAFTADLTQQQLDEFYDADDPHTPAEGLLSGATTRIVYDLHRFRHTVSAAPDEPMAWGPIFAATISRETHTSDLVLGQHSKTQISFSYSDGFGREIQKKVQAEPGPIVHHGPVVDPRWVGSGWTIYDNKGQPVRQYESFFSLLPTRGHQYEFDARVGVSSILCYDPVGRVVATIRPNHTYEKVVFDPWYKETWDVNDTVLEVDPGSDPDVGSFFVRLPHEEYLPTWYAQRAGGALGAQEHDAANKAAAHANTPTLMFLDALGRTFLTIADNAAEGKYATHRNLDIQSNQRSVTDALERHVMHYEYDLLGRRICQASMEAGTHCTLADVTGKTIRAWDSRGHEFRTTYDALRRPTAQFVRGSDLTQSDPRTLGSETLYDNTIYGEGQPNDKVLNLRTRVFQHRDSAGLVTNMGRDPATNQDEAYDYKGNLLRSNRQFVADYKALPNWSTASPTMQAEVFSSSTRYDALNRAIATTTPDGSVIRPTFNMANLLERVDVSLRGAERASRYIANIGYNAKGQRLLVAYGNNATSHYAYDPATFRLVRLTTTRHGVAANEMVVQDLSYTFDPSGNITHIRDEADIQNVVFFRNKRVEPSSDYTYDAIYRLIVASGREHLGQDGTGKPLPPTPTSYSDAPRMGLVQPGDGNAMGTYTEQYQYDAVGNIQQLVHLGSDLSTPSWRRTFTYNEPSLLEPASVSNRLTRTTLNPGGAQPIHEDYAYDPHGSMMRMPQLQTMAWDFKEQLVRTQRQAMNASDHDGLHHQGERTYYVYSAAGERVRKVTHRQNGTLKSERIYLGKYEIYREYNGAGTEAALERQTLHAMDDMRRVALIETRTIDTSVGAGPLPSTTTRYQFDNHLGSACLELDEMAAVLSYEEYYPYGGTAYQAGRTAAEVGLKRYRYTGKERDEETGLYYSSARYYAPWLGRWTSADPVGLVDGVNVYAYARDRPITAVDPTGTQHEDIGADPELQAAARSVHDARPDLANAPAPTVPAGPTVTYPQARSQARAGQRAFRQSLGLTGSTVQAGHTMRVKESVNTQLPSAVRDQPATMMALHSRVDPSLEVRITDQTGQTVVRTRHTGQEVLITQAQDQAEARTGGVLTREGQVAASQDVLYQAENTPLDQRNVDQVLSSPRSSTGLSSVDANVNLSTGEVEPGPQTNAALERLEERQASSAASPPNSTTGGGAPFNGLVNVAGNTAAEVTRTVVPGVAETETALMGGAYLAYTTGHTAFVAPLMTASEAVPIVGGGLVAGAVVGNLAEGTAKSLGASQGVAEASGALAAGLTGAGVGALIGAPTGIGAPVGAAIGFVAGVAGYYLSKWF